VGCCDISEIGAKFPAVAHGDFELARCRKNDVLQAVEIGTENRFEFIMAQFQHVEFDEQGAVGGMKIADAGNGLQLEEMQETADAAMSLECDLLAEGNQQGLIACGLESGAAGVHGGAHRVVIVTLAESECEPGRERADCLTFRAIEPNERFS
jgi:hypothetical protein